MKMYVDENVDEMYVDLCMQMKCMQMKMQMKMYVAENVCR